MKCVNGGFPGKMYEYYCIDIVSPSREIFEIRRLWEHGFYIDFLSVLNVHHSYYYWSYELIVEIFIF